MLALKRMTNWQRMFAPRGATFKALVVTRAEIHRYDAIDDSLSWARCRDQAQFHLGRARRAKDRGSYQEAAREIERALRYDDTSEAYFQVVAQCHLNSSPRDLAAARGALERAFTINPRNGYTIKLLARVYEADGMGASAERLVERALAAGAPSGVGVLLSNRGGSSSQIPTA